MGKKGDVRQKAYAAFMKEHKIQRATPPSRYRGLVSGWQGWTPEEEKKMELKFVIAPRGNVLIGDYTLIGPFDSIKEAQDWIDEAKRLDQNPYDCIIVQVASGRF